MKLYNHIEQTHNTRSPKEVVPILVDFFNPKSVLDVGCGIGTWLNVFKENEIEHVLGVDGEYVDEHLVKKYLRQEEFLKIDLRKPFDLNSKFDLLISLEVAEHLPPDSAEIFVSSLCNHSDNIVFSAALPNQGGQNHLNEQWINYWASIFHKFSYKLHDVIRPAIWNNQNVDWWYKQNMVVFSSDSKLQLKRTSLHGLNLVHPALFKQKVDEYDNVYNELSYFKFGPIHSSNKIQYIDDIKKLTFNYFKNLFRVFYRFLFK